MAKTIKSGMKQFAVLGLGRFGTEITKALNLSGCEVLAVDIDEEKTLEIADYATHTVIADVSEESTLRAIGIDSFDAVIIAIGDNMQASIIAALICKEMGVKYILAKAHNDKHGKVLEKIGVDCVIFPEAAMAVKTATMLTNPRINDLVELTADYSIAEIEIPQTWAGRSLLELGVRNKYKVNVLIIIRGNTIISTPTGDAPLEDGDHLVVGALTEDIKRFSLEINRLK